MRLNLLLIATLWTLSNLAHAQDSHGGIGIPFQVPQDNQHTRTEQVIRFNTDPDGIVTLLEDAGAKAPLNFDDLTGSNTLIAVLYYKMEHNNKEFKTVHYTDEYGSITLDYRMRELPDFEGLVPYTEDRIEVKVYENSTFEIINTPIVFPIQSDNLVSNTPVKYWLDEFGILTQFPQKNFIPSPPVNIIEKAGMEEGNGWVPVVFVEFFKYRALAIGEPSEIVKTEEGLLLSMKCTSTDLEIEINVDGWYPLPRPMPKGAKIHVRRGGKLTELTTLTLVSEEFFEN